MQKDMRQSMPVLCVQLLKSGGLTVPGTGRYSLEATWPGGSWHLTFAAGLVPSYS